MPYSVVLLVSSSWYSGLVLRWPIIRLRVGSLFPQKSMGKTAKHVSVNVTCE